MHSIEWDGLCLRLLFPFSFISSSVALLRLILNLVVVVIIFSKECWPVDRKTTVEFCFLCYLPAAPTFSFTRISVYIFRIRVWIVDRLVCGVNERTEAGAAVNICVHKYNSHLECECGKGDRGNSHSPRPPHSFNRNRITLIGANMQPSIGVC